MLRTLANQLPSLAALAAPGTLGAALLAPVSAAALLRQAATTTALASMLQRTYSTDSYKKLVQNGAPRSLEFPRQPAEAVAAERQRSAAAMALLSLFGYYSKESRHMRAAKLLYAAVTEHAESAQFLEAMGIPADFQQTHSSLCLHIWLLLVRLRAEGKDGKQLAQMLYDDFQSDVEDRARKAGVKVRLSKQLTELEKQFYGSSMAYDRALQDGKEPLDQALLRNVYLLAGDKGAEAHLLARYVRRELACLAMTPSEAVMAGNVKFSAEGLDGSSHSSSSYSSSSDQAASADSLSGSGKGVLA